MIIDILIIVFLMLAAILLLIAEIFLLPGITVAGIGGALFAFGGIIYAYTISPTVGTLTLIASIIVFCCVFVLLMRKNSFKRVALNTDISSKIASPREKDVNVGEEGITLSRLAPIGKARFKNVTVEAKSENGFIDEHTTVVIKQVTGCNVIVAVK